MSASITIGGRVDLGPVTKLLRSLKARSRDLRGVFWKIDEQVTIFFETQFESYGVMGGHPWPELAPMTILAKMRRGRGRAGPDAIGRDTNKMWAAFTKAGGPNSVRVIEPQMYERGERGLPYVEPFSEGWLSKNVYKHKRKVAKRIPARPIVPTTLPVSLTGGWEGMIANYIDGMDL